MPVISRPINIIPFEEIPLWGYFLLSEELGKPSPATLYQKENELLHHGEVVNAIEFLEKDETRLAKNRFFAATTDVVPVY